MGEARGGGGEGTATEELILRMVALHAGSLLRTARRHSLCADDAQDAYQRTLELFMAHAERLDPARAPGWLHVVVKREAQAIRSSRTRLVSSSDAELAADGADARCVPTPEDQLFAFDLVKRSAEALQRLKPHELQALWLKAQGHSYSDIGAITGWSYTKVNRCLTEGRRSFLERYAAIESGAECGRWLPVISVLVDGEATAEQLLELRPHLRNCPGCRATLKALQDSTEPLAAVLPIPLLGAASAENAESVAHVLVRFYETVVAGVSERAASSVAKLQALLDASASGKMAAIASSPRPGVAVAAVAGCLAAGGGATYCVQEDVDPFAVVSGIVVAADERRRPSGAKKGKQARAQVAPAPPVVTPALPPAPEPQSAAQPTPEPPPAPPPPPTPQEEYEPIEPVATAASAQRQPSSGPSKPAPAPAGGAGEFDGP